LNGRVACTALAATLGAVKPLNRHWYELAKTLAQ
jgi:hypothetical protein